MEPSEPVDLNQVRALTDATPAPPWELFADDDDVIGKRLATTYPHGFQIIRTPLHEPSRAGIDTPDEWAVAEFIAAARSLVPALCDEIERLREALERMLDEGGNDLSGCAYYTRDEEDGDPEGTCSYGCHEEPECITCCPLEGWPREQARAALGRS